MKYLKDLGLLAAAMGVMLALAATASATTITSSEGETPSISAGAEGHAVIDNPIAKIECSSNFGGTIFSHGAGRVAEGSLSSMWFSGCTNSWHVTVAAASWFSIEATGGGNGTLTWDHVTIEATRFGVSCRYKTKLFGTPVGTITGGTPSTIHLNGALPFHSGSVLCGSGATTITGSYIVNFPFSLSVDS